MGGKPSTTVTENDPWKNFDKSPQFVQDYVKGNLENLGGAQDWAGDIAGEMGDNPREVLGPSDGETRARDILNRTGNRARGDINDAMSGVGGIEGPGGSDFSEAERLAGLAEAGLPGDFEGGYVNDVVDTTLEGMDRQAQREALARESQGAAIGGTSNSRTAVGNAVADQLTGMNMGKMEAQLRDDAKRFGTDASFKSADMLRSLGLDAQGREGQGFDERLAAGNFEMERGTTMADLAKSKFGIGQGQAAGNAGFGELERGLAQQGMDAEWGSDQQAASWLTSILGGTQTNVAQGNTQSVTEPAPSPFSQIMGAAAMAGGMFMSDEASKEDIAYTTGSDLDKLSKIAPATYSYRPGYGHREDRHTGLIAQDIERAGIEGAVLTNEDGLKVVDSYPVLATIVGAVRELDERTR